MRSWSCWVLVVAGCRGAVIDAGSNEGGPSVVASAGIGNLCTSWQPPPPPPASPRPVPDGVGDLDLTFAAQESELGVTTRDVLGRPLYESIGFDLDHSCTSSGQKRGCVEPSWADAAHNEVDGIDNAYGQMLWQEQPDPTVIDAGTLLPLTAQVLLIRVSGYNGQASDDQVTVAVYVGVGPPSRPDGQAGPLWDGNDIWAVFQETLSSDGGTPDVDQPLYADSNAYVTNGVLVAHLPEARWPSNALAQPPRVTGVVMAGTLAGFGDAGSGWVLTNLMFGFRMSETETLIQVASIYDGTGPYLCDSPFNYDRVKAQFCAVVDVTSNPDASPSTPCDAISVGALVQAQPAKLGASSTTTWNPLTCDPGVDPYTDHCP